MENTPKNIDLELSAIYEISKILGSSLDLKQSVRQVLGILASYLQMKRGTVNLVQGDGNLEIFGAHGLTEEEINKGRFSKGEGIVGRIAKGGTPIVIPDVASEPLFLNRTGSRVLDKDAKIAFIGVPIKIGTDVIGVLTCDREATDHKGQYQRDVKLLTMVAGLIAQTFRLHQSVKVERDQLIHEKQRLQKELRVKYSIDNIIGRSKRMQEVFAEVYQVAPTKSTVLLRGESGTGKEVIARAIHNLSPRRDAPFVRVNCAALTETLLESELFGHVRGAFTGATQERKGRFEMAHKGTLFLDEIGEISLSFQTKLLRVLQEREFERVGGNTPIKVDVRLICATNRNLEEDVAKGTFRADLYYRINVVSIFLSPLRERREDIPLLAEYFIDRFNKTNNRSLKIAPETIQVMLDCNWPGNVRELENCVERSATMTKSDVINALDLPCQHGKCFSMALQSYDRNVKSNLTTIPVVPSAMPSPRAASKSNEEPTNERDRLIWAMEQTGWVQAKAARLLKMSPRQIGYALKKYNIPVKRL